MDKGKFLIEVEKGGGCILGDINVVSSLASIPPMPFEVVIQRLIEKDRKRLEEEIKKLADKDENTYLFEFDCALKEDEEREANGEKMEI